MMKIVLPDLPARKVFTGPEPRATSEAEEHLFARLLSQVNGLQQQADLKIRDFLLGRADLHEVMLSLERASLGLKLLVQTRNKIIQAYEELSRMNL
ncbi:MAG: flagellar hook-basal body complex protein FliE [Deltaproteobacteria bacterium]|nr:flagellar hook-basal body complex protein FliE [Deltaproteobacteria bacterium]